MVGDGLNQKQEDALVNLIMTKVAEGGAYSESLEAMDPQDRRVVEEALERHAARMRAEGKPGW